MKSNKEDSLIRFHRSFRPFVNALNCHSIARKVYRKLLALRYRDGQLSHAEQNGRFWKLDPEVALRGAFQEYETIEWLRQVIKPGMSVLDIGANVGQMTLEMAYLVGEDGYVIAVEPAPGNIKVLQRHVKENGFGARVKIIEAACSDEDGVQTDLNVIGDDLNCVGSGHSIIETSVLKMVNPNSDVHRMRIECISIDGICSRMGISPTVIKIDVEGAELLVLRGAVETLNYSRPSVRFAFHPFAFNDPEEASLNIHDLFGAVNYKILGNNRGHVFELAEYVAVPDIASIS